MVCSRDPIDLIKIPGHGQKCVKPEVKPRKKERNRKKTWGKSNRKIRTNKRTDFCVCVRVNRRFSLSADKNQQDKEERVLNMV